MWIAHVLRTELCQHSSREGGFVTPVGCSCCMQQHLVAHCMHLEQHVTSFCRGGDMLHYCAGDDMSRHCMSHHYVTSRAGDGTIRQWQGATCVNTFKGHTDTVRGLAPLPGVGFVSGSHDFTCKVRYGRPRRDECGVSSIGPV
jgi:WD40 repeat protein